MIAYGASRFDSHDFIAGCGPLSQHNEPHGRYRKGCGPYAKRAKHRERQKAKREAEKAIAQA